MDGEQGNSNLGCVGGGYWVHLEGLVLGSGGTALRGAREQALLGAGCMVQVTCLGVSAGW